MNNLDTKFIHFQQFLTTFHQILAETLHTIQVMQAPISQN